MLEDDLIIDTEYEEVDIEDLNPDVTHSETVQVIEVEDVELYTVDTFDAFNALGEPNERLRHQLLNGRDMPDQHPITAITGLRDELDDIEALQTVYSNGKQMADYYKWEDENILYENRVGYFVSLCEDVRNIKICNGENIFGVVIDDAAFIGGQDDIARNHEYGLVLYTGVAHVRCELDVDVGDCVISNNYGMAKKTENNYGCKVIAIDEIKGVRCAAIALNLSIDQIDLVGKDLKSFEDRMDKAEINIISAINVANETYNKLDEIEQMSENAQKNASDAVSKSEEALSKTDQNVIQTQEAMTAAKIAQSIAESAIVTIETDRKEAIEAANNALSETMKAREDFEAEIDRINNNLNESAAEMENTKQELADIIDEFNADMEHNEYIINATRETLRSDIDAFKNDLNLQVEDIENNLNSQVQDITNDLNSRADEIESGLNSQIENISNNFNSQIEDVTNNFNLQIEDVTDDFNSQIENVSNDFNSRIENITSDLNLQVGDVVNDLREEIETNYASKESVTALKTSTEQSIADIKQEVSDTYATIASVTDFKTEITEAIAGVKQEASETYATIESVTELDTKTSNSITGVIQKVSDEYATITSVTELETDISNTIAGVRQEVSDTYATIESVSKLETDTTNAIAGVKQEAADTYATIESVTKLESDTTDAIAGVVQKVSDEYATIESMTELRTDVSDAITGIRQDVSDNYATIESVTKLQTDTTNTISGIVQEASEKYATIDSVVKLEGDMSDAISAVESIATENAASLSAISSYTHTDKYGNTTTGLSGLKSQVEANKSELDLLSTFKTETSEGLSGLQTQVNKNSSDLVSLSEFECYSTESVISYPYVDATTTVNGIKFIDDGKGTITVDGKATESAIFCIAKNISLSDGSYMLSGCPTGGSSDTYHIWVQKTDSESSITHIKECGEKQKFTIENGDIISIWIRIMAGTTVENLVFSPKVVKLISSGLSGLKSQVNANKSSIDLLTTFEGEEGDGTAGLIATVTEHESKLSNIATWQGQQEKSLATVQQKADANESSISSLAEWKGEVENDVSSIAIIRQKANENETSIQSLTEWKNGQIDVIAGIEQQTSDNAASIQALTQWKGEVEEDVESIASIKQKADANESSIKSLTEWKDEQVDAIAAVQQKANTNESSIKSLTQWKNEAVNSIANVEQKATVNEASLSVIADYTHTDKDGNTTKGLAGLKSQVNANKSELDLIANYKYTDEVGNTTEGLAGLRSQVDKNKSELDLIADYEHKDKDGNITKGLAGLQAQVDENKSELDLIASFEGNEATGIAGLITTVTENESELDLIADYEYTDEKGNVKKGLAGLSSQVDVNKSELDLIADYEHKDKNGNITKGLAGLKSQVDANAADITSLAGFDDELKDNIAQIKQTADANGAHITSLVASIDKYSVGEYSQAYGLTYEQAKSILKEGMIYVPIGHPDGKTHSEEYEGQGQINEFTEENYYVWIGDDWEEHNNSVVFAKNVPEQIDTLQYWYINYNEAPEGYEAHTLYVRQDKQWKRVNILEGNASNRAISMIRQDQNAIALEVTNTRGSVATLGAKLSETDSKVTSLTNWQGKTSETIAGLVQSASDNKASITQIVQNIGADGEVNAASIVTAINNSDSIIALNADHINLQGFVTANKTFTIDTNGSITAIGGKMGGWNITDNKIYAGDGINTKTAAIQIPRDGMSWVFAAGGTSHSNYSDCPFRVHKSGKLYAKDAEIDGTITATGGKIAGWDILSSRIETTDADRGTFYLASATNSSYDNWLVAKDKDGTATFLVSKKGKLTATSVDISGKITATSGSFTGKITSTEGNIGGWNITSNLIKSTGDEKAEFYLASAVNTSYSNWIVAKNKAGDTTFKISKTGVLTATGVNITGVINARSGGSIGAWSVGNSSLYGYSSSGYVQITPSNVYVEDSKGNGMTGYWNDMVLAGMSYNSDQKLKNNINNLNDDYENFFNKLMPVSFYYNSSHRPYDYDKLHFGFIAQDIIKAFGECDLKDLSLVYNGNYYKVDKQEVIALNTWQIQKAKARITELEERVAQLEELIKEK